MAYLMWKIDFKNYSIDKRLLKIYKYKIQFLPILLFEQNDHQLAYFNMLVPFEINVYPILIKLWF
jgi:hypothetical protein